MHDAIRFREGRDDRSAPGAGPSTSSSAGPGPPSSRICAGTGRSTSACCSTTCPSSSSGWVAPRSLGPTVVGINPTRRGEELAATSATPTASVIVTDTAHRPCSTASTSGLPRPGARTSTIRRLRDARWPRTAAPPAAAAERRRRRPVPAPLHLGHRPARPKAVHVHARAGWPAAASRLERLRPRRPDDVPYLAMPLFHGNALIAGVVPAAWPARRGAATPLLGVGVPRRRPRVRRHVLQLRRQAPRLRPRHARTRPTTPTTRCRLVLRHRGRRAATCSGSAAASGATSSTATARPRAASSSSRDPAMPPGALGQRRRGHRRSRRPRDRRGVPAGALRRRRRLLNPDEAIGEIVGTDRRRRLRGLLQQRRSRRASGSATAGTGPATSPTADGDGFVLLRRPGGRVAAGRRRELRRRTGRAHPGPPPRRRRGRRVRRARRRASATRSWPRSSPGPVGFRRGRTGRFPGRAGRPGDQVGASASSG